MPSPSGDPEGPPAVRADGGDGDATGEAAYVFRATLGIETPAGLRVEPDRFETVVEREAAAPGDPEADWLFFRDHLWRGAAADEAHLRELIEEALTGRPPAGVDGDGGGRRRGLVVEDVSFSELRTDAAYLDALRGAIADELAAGTGAFGNADGVEAVLNSYLGSSIHVREG